MKNLQLSRIIETYLKGWEIGDGELSLSVTTNDFSYDDPDTGTILRTEFVSFVNDFKQAAVEMGGKENANPFLSYSDKVIDEHEKSAIVWCWWHAVGTDLQGCALIKVSEEGILHEKIAYFSKLP
ncbi:MAG: hypothetical protein V7749_02130 [Cocleimonas sp.]